MQVEIAPRATDQPHTDAARARLCRIFSVEPRCGPLLAPRLCSFIGPSSRGGGAALLDPARHDSVPARSHQRALEAPGTSKEGYCCDRESRGCALGPGRPSLCLCFVRRQSRAWLPRLRSRSSRCPRLLHMPLGIVFVSSFLCAAGRACTSLLRCSTRLAIAAVAAFKFELRLGAQRLPHCSGSRCDSRSVGSRELRRGKASG